jgi:hypothetical protein
MDCDDETLEKEIAKFAPLKDSSLDVSSEIAVDSISDLYIQSLESIHPLRYICEALFDTIKLKLTAYINQIAVSSIPNAISHTFYKGLMIGYLLSKVEKDVARGMHIPVLINAFDFMMDRNSESIKRKFSDTLEVDGVEELDDELLESFKESVEIELDIAKVFRSYKERGILNSIKIQEALFDAYNEEMSKATLDPDNYEIRLMTTFDRILEEREQLRKGGLK